MIRVVVIASLGSDRRPCLLCILSLAHHFRRGSREARNDGKARKQCLKTYRSSGHPMVIARGVLPLDSLGTEP